MILCGFALEVRWWYLKMCFSFEEKNIFHPFLFIFVLEYILDVTLGLKTSLIRSYICPRVDCIIITEFGLGTLVQIASKVNWLHYIQIHWVYNFYQLTKRVQSRGSCNYDLLLNNYLAWNKGIWKFFITIHLQGKTHLK